MDIIDQELQRIFQLSINKFLHEIRQENASMILNVYDSLEKNHIFGGYSTGFANIYTEKEIEELRKTPLEIPCNSLMDYALHKMKQNSSAFLISIYRIDCETENIYEYYINEQNKFDDYDRQLPNSISMGAKQKQFLKNTINKLNESKQENYNQYYFSSYIYRAETRYIAFLNLFSSINLSDKKAKEFFLKVKDFLLNFAPFMVLYKYRMDSETMIRIAESYKRLAYLIMHEENGFADTIDDFINKLLYSYPSILENTEIKNVIRHVEFQKENIRQFNSELGGRDPLRKVDPEIIYNSEMNIIDEVNVAIEYAKDFAENLDIKTSFSQTVIENPRLNISMHIVRRILKQLIKNSIQIGNKRDITSIKIKINIDIENELDNKILVIQVIDNCGGFKDINIIGKITYDKFSTYLLNKYGVGSYERGAGWLTILRYVESTSGSMISGNHDYNEKGAILTLRIPIREGVEEL